MVQGGQTQGRVQWSLSYGGTWEHRKAKEKQICKTKYQRRESYIIKEFWRYAGVPLQSIRVDH